MKTSALKKNSQMKIRSIKPNLNKILSQIARFDSNYANLGSMGWLPGSDKCLTNEQISLNQYAGLQAYLGNQGFMRLVRTMPMVGQAHDNNKLRSDGLVKRAISSEFQDYAMPDLGERLSAHQRNGMAQRAEGNSPVGHGVGLHISSGESGVLQRKIKNLDIKILNEIINKLSKKNYYKNPQSFIKKPKQGKIDKNAFNKNALDESVFDFKKGILAFISAKPKSNNIAPMQLKNIKVAKNFEKKRKQLLHIENVIFVGKKAKIKTNNYSEYFVPVKNWRRSTSGTRNNKIEPSNSLPYGGTDFTGNGSFYGMNISKNERANNFPARINQKKNFRNRRMGGHDLNSSFLEVDSRRNSFQNESVYNENLLYKNQASFVRFETKNKSRNYIANDSSFDYGHGNATKSIKKSDDLIYCENLANLIQTYNRFDDNDRNYRHQLLLLNKIVEELRRFPVSLSTFQTDCFPLLINAVKDEAESVNACLNIAMAMNSYLPQKRRKSVVVESKPLQF
jgi:hypothetical protein